MKKTILAASVLLAINTAAYADMNSQIQQLGPNFVQLTLTKAPGSPDILLDDPVVTPNPYLKIGKEYPGACPNTLNDRNSCVINLIGQEGVPLGNVQTSITVNYTMMGVSGAYATHYNVNFKSLLYAGGMSLDGQGLMLESFDGTTWQAVADMNDPNGEVNSLVVDPAFGNVYAGGFFSVKDQQSQTITNIAAVSSQGLSSVGNTNPNTYINSMVYVSKMSGAAQDLLVTGTQNGAYTFNGQTWNALGDLNIPITALTDVPGSNYLVYAGTPQGIFKISTEDPQGWQAFGSGPMNTHVLATDETGTLFFSGGILPFTNMSGLYENTLFPSAWTPLFTNQNPFAFTLLAYIATAPYISAVGFDEGQGVGLITSGSTNNLVPSGLLGNVFALTTDNDTVQAFTFAGGSNLKTNSPTSSNNLVEAAQLSNNTGLTWTPLLSSTSPNSVINALVIASSFTLSVQ